MRTFCGWFNTGLATRLFREILGYDLKIAAISFDVCDIKM